MKKFLIAGTFSGVGKTTLTLGIMGALKKRGLKVQPYKVGPDYIDTAYHTHMTGQSSRNLDAYMLKDDQLIYLFNRAMAEKDVAVVEGVMGLYDGYGVDINSCSSSYVAKLLKIPVILVIDGQGMGASAAAMVLGYKLLDQEVEIKGVIVNHVKTASHYKLIQEAVYRYTGIETLGYFPPNEELELGSRHLGLIPSQEMNGLEDKLEKLVEAVEQFIDLNRLIALCEGEEVTTHFRPQISKTKDLKLGVAYDEAFNFYYEDNLELLRDCGVQLIYFSPLRDQVLPTCDGYYIGGGFPEVFGKELEANKALRQALKEAHQAKVPIYGECGGLMYLGESLQDKEGKSYEMVGILPGKSVMTESLKRFGYCEAKANRKTILSQEGQVLRGHEFHHSEFKTELEGAYTLSKDQKKEIMEEWQGGFESGHTLATYLHLHFYTEPTALESFIKVMEKKKEEVTKNE